MEYSPESVLGMERARMMVERDDDLAVVAAATREALSERLAESGVHDVRRGSAPAEAPRMVESRLKK